MTRQVIQDSFQWRRTLPNTDEEQTLYDLKKAQFVAAVRVTDAYEAATQAAEERGEDPILAGFEALFAASVATTSNAIGELMNSSQENLSEMTTYLLAGGMARHIRLNTNTRLSRHLASYSSNPERTLHTELPAALRQAYAERHVGVEQQKLPPSLFENAFLNAVIQALTGQTASTKETAFPINEETGEVLDLAARPNSLHAADAQNVTEATVQIESRDFLLALAAEASLSANERQLFDLFLEDGSLFEHGGNAALAQKLGRSASQIGVEKSRLLAKLAQAGREQEE